MNRNWLPIHRYERFSNTSGKFYQDIQVITLKNYFHLVGKDL